MNKKKGEGFLSFITPMRSIRRAVTSVASAKDAITGTVKEMANRLPGQAVGNKFEEGDVRLIVDARERYEAMYELYGWSEPEMKKQLRTLRTTKMVAFVVAIVSMIAVVVLAAVTPVWIALILIPVSGSILVLGLSQGFKYALYEAQINLAELISAREFVSRDDFWRRLFR